MREIELLPRKDRIFPSIQPVPVREIAARDLGESESAQFLLHLPSNLPRERRKERPFELRGAVWRRRGGRGGGGGSSRALGRAVMPAVGSV